MAEPKVTVITRQYVEISKTTAQGVTTKVIFPIDEVSDLVVQLAKLLPSDVPPSS